MRAHERRRWKRIDDMLIICHERGITSAMLAPIVTGACESIGQKSYGDDVNSKGLASQISYLSQAMGRALEGKLRRLGGVLDAIAVQTSDPEARAIGIEHLDASGDVVISDED